MTDANPLLADWTAPFGLPPFDRIRPEHFAPAIEAGMASHRAEIAAIGARTEPPDFGNTALALERAGRSLGRTLAVFGNLSASLGGEALEALEREFAPRLARHYGEIGRDEAVFARVRDLHGRRAALGLAEDQARLLERMHLDFIRNGAALTPEARARMGEIGERLAALHTQFGQNVLADEKAWHLALAEADLAGLPDFARDSARAAAAERGLEGYAVTLSRSLIEPFLTFSERRDLREAAWRAWMARGAREGTHDNRPLIPQILALRQEQARLLGHPHYAAFRLADSMAGGVEAARGLLERVWEAAKCRAAAEEGQLREIAGEAIAPWDWRFYAEKLRERDFALDEAGIKPYFEAGRMQEAAFDVAGRLFGVSFTPIEAPLYHPDIRAWEARDAGGHVGVFLADPFARPDKRSGAWMSSFRDQEAMDGAVSAIVVNNNNFARATPTLLSFDDAQTLFHEFGHGLHGLLSQVRYPSQSGTGVRRDFVELPSQIYEHWLACPEILRLHARHHATGEPLPEETIARLRAARTFNQGFATVEYAASALLDLALHEMPDPADLDVDAFERRFLAGIRMPAAIPLRHRPGHFQHLFAGGGYAASYYAYLWAEVLDADGFEAFEEAGDAFDAETAGRLKAIYAAGDNREPMALYRAFRGREPRVEALLRGRGLDRI